MSKPISSTTVFIAAAFLAVSCSAQSTIWNSYWIRTFASTNMCVDVNSGVTTNGAVIDLYACTPGATNELFGIKEWANDTTYFTIHPNHNPSACLTVENALSTNGARIVGWDCSGAAANQLWTILPSHLCSKVIYFLNKGSGKCMTWNGAAPANGVGLVQYDCIEQFNQQWWIDVQGYNSK